LWGKQFGAIVLRRNWRKAYGVQTRAPGRERKNKN